jgi:hypothetical protein
VNILKRFAALALLVSAAAVAVASPVVPSPFPLPEDPDGGFTRLV